MQFETRAIMKTKSTFAALALFATLTIGPLHADPQLTSWFTTYSCQYARIYSNAASETTGNAVTTWSNGSQTQALPAYDGIQEIDSSTDWIYALSTGLGSHIMGPWSVGFPNLPENQKTLFRFPRTPAAPATKSLNGGGAIGIFVDGVAMFNSWDAFYYDGSADTSATGNTGGYWNHDAYVNEGATFDPAYAHQQNTGTYHYHADPIALRYFLGDQVSYNAVSNSYSELKNVVTKHSPILAWVGDGYPLYGPYGYSNPTNANSGIRRMISGYVPRNGLNGTDNLSTNNAPRTYLPAWALREYTAAGAQNGTTNGPAVSSSYPFGRYLEDNAYLGDLTNSHTGQPYQQGTDFDLDEYNGRFCVTPEFPNGTYAYFVCISSNGVPVYPYNIGRAYYGNPTGGSVTAITETVTTNFLGGTNSPFKLAPLTRQNSAVTLVWSAVEGGSYEVESTTNLSTWSVVASNLSPVKIIGSCTNVTALDKCYYRVARTGVASFDPATGSNGSTDGGILSVSPMSANPGATFTLTINLNSAANPAPPPQNAPINSVTVGTITGSSNTHVSQTEVTSSITIPANATPGAVTVTVIFPGPQTDPSMTVTYTLANGFTIK
jgi:hypothetical protein